MKKLKWLTLACCFFLSSHSYANLLDSHEIDMTVINNTDTTFTYLGAYGTNPGNTFELQDNVIYPHSVAHIYGRINQNFDLCASLMFQDDQGTRESFFVLDPRQFHMSQPVFLMNSKVYQSQLDKSVRNPTIDPTALLITGVTVTFNYT